MDDSPPAWDEEVAAALMGALVIIGLTHLDADGVFVSQEQYFGRVIAVDRNHSITLRLDGSRDEQEYVLPPQTSAFHKAEPGEYRLRSTGEIVWNPDFTTNWTVNASKADKL
jgi:hypothetical protein